MNQPYVKEFLKDENGSLVLDKRGRKIVANPLVGDYIPTYPNRQTRKRILRENSSRGLNNRKGRNYYQPKMKPVFDPIGKVNEETGEVTPLILYSIPDGNKTIAHRKY
jgi:hypothetical protein